ncbi:MaoC/PaaZ C-terminal domain-containing protein [Streptomyces pristinaespiralis]|uniref:MaoC domain-containing protein n=2 Tax=Streptomyces pristinaespiralis TaxID=38300 RepID=B5H6S9_STRE2|nr:MaoC/PaaZ C-terminal domain-containing protein [Streptomyces pristinaespiralis]ALC18708.1 dehydratase [Streptomyces pristinaespiralis]EDY62540.1 MaoC domain-containing protein [Streptomyces pristinaespiralis ATCC 25486]QMU18129.1 dehydratase [Streptomyces pristinaespiralis]
MKLLLPRISRTDLALYAGASGDHNPMHIDLDVAKSAGLEDVFAHGMLSMAYLGRLLTSHVPQERIRSFNVRFTSITPVNARPTAIATVTKTENGLTYLDLAMTLEDGTVTLAGTAVIEGEIAA